MGACLPTFDQLAAVCGARVELQGDDMTLGLVEELNWDSDRGRHGRGLSSLIRGAEREREVVQAGRWWDSNSGVGACRVAKLGRARFAT